MKNNSIWADFLEERWGKMSVVQGDIEREALLRDTEAREEDYEKWLKDNNFREEVAENGVTFLIKFFPIYQ